MATRSKTRARRKSVTRRKPRATARKKTKAKASRSRATKKAAKRTTSRKKTAAKKKRAGTTRKVAAARARNATPAVAKHVPTKPSAQKPPLLATPHASQVAAATKAGATTSAAPASAAPASVAATVPELVGRISHYFAHVNAGVIVLEHGVLRVGDTVHIRGHTTDFYQRLEHMEVDHRPIELARAGQSVGIQVAQRVREHDQVFKVSK